MDHELHFQDRDFVVLRMVDGVPTMAGCVRCGYKFFSPGTFKGDEYGARMYLARKFTGHKCNIQRGRESGTARTLTAYVPSSGF